MTVFVYDQMMSGVERQMGYWEQVEHAAIYQAARREYRFS
jgi:hypothetical protein